MANQGSTTNFKNVAYSLSQPTTNMAPFPIVAKRAPLSSDVGYALGQLWIYNSTAYVLVAVVSKLATWNLLESSGGAGVFTTVVASSTITAGTGITSTTGNIVATAGAVTAGTSMSATTTITAGTGITATTGNITATNGNVVLGTAGNKLSITTGTNASIGQSAAMTAGSITISTTAVTASSLIFLTNALPGGTVGTLSVGTITAGTSFVINSSSATDTSKVNWWIIN